MNQRSHEDLTGKLVAWINGELHVEENAALERHVQTCPRCRKALKEYELLSQRLHALEKAVAEPVLSPVLLALKQEIAHHHILEEAQQLVEQTHLKITRDSAIKEKFQKERERVTAWTNQEDRIIVTEMLGSPDSQHWTDCDQYVKKLVQSLTKNISLDQREDIAQEAMLHITRLLPTFRYDCMLTTWIFSIVHSCIIDNYRKSARAPMVVLFSRNVFEENENEGEFAQASTSHTAEDLSVIHEELDSVVAVLRHYLFAHANTQRNTRILELFVYEGRSVEEIAKIVGCSSGVVGYVIRTAQRYLREQFGH